MGCANGKLQNAMGAYVLQFQLYQREALPYWLASIIMLGNALAVRHYTPRPRAFTLVHSVHCHAARALPYT
jgi:hypothetical protein